MRIILAEDSVLFREGLSRLLTEAGHRVEIVGDADALIAVVGDDPPDLAIVDVRMPPGMADDGVVAAKRLRSDHPSLPILLLSQHIETRQAMDLVASGGFGYLLKDSVLRVDDFLDAMRRVAEGGSALDPAVVGALVAESRAMNPMGELTPREREVLRLVAEGKSNAAISAELVVSERTVETHMRTIFQKLAIDDSGSSHRRVTAVLAFLSRL